MNNQLLYTLDPGPFEQQVQRREGNPLFGDGQHVSLAELERAQGKDRDDLKAFAEEFQSLLQDAAQLSGKAETEFVLDLKSRADKLYEQCCGLGGDRSKEKQGLLRFNDVVMQAIRAAAGDDPLAMQELEREQQARQMHLQLLEIPIVPALLRTDSPIGEDELVPSLLSIDAGDCRTVLTLFEPPQLAEILVAAEALLNGVQEAGEGAKACLDVIREAATAQQG